jgi:hypothetical protein
MSTRRSNKKELELAAKELERSFHPEDRSNFRSNKLMGGIIRIAFVVIFLKCFGVHWNEQATPFLCEPISALIGEETGNFIAVTIVGTGHILLLVVLIKGVYKTLTFNRYFHEFER